MTPARLWLRVPLHRLVCPRGHTITSQVTGEWWVERCATCAERTCVVRVGRTVARVTRVTRAEADEITRRALSLGAVLELLGAWAVDPLAGAASLDRSA